MPDTAPSLFLIGYRGSGKTTVGCLLAEQLRRRLVDTDRLVVEALGMSIAECFATAGEPVFRSREGEVLEAVCRRVEAGEKLVVSTGGGIILRPANVARLRATGLVVWLSASASTLARRISSDPDSAASRPLLTGAVSSAASSADEVAQVLRAREPVYRAAAHIEVSGEGVSPGEVAERIMTHLREGKISGC